MEQQSPLAIHDIKEEHSTLTVLTNQQTTFPCSQEQISVRIVHQENIDSDLPIVMVLQDTQGFTHEIDNFCQHLAHHGYLTIAPDLFSHQHKMLGIPSSEKIPDDCLKNIKDYRVLSLLDRCAHWALGQGGRSRSLAVIGFGWGARVSWLYCAHTPQLKAAISCDPILNYELTLAQPISPIAKLGCLQAPLLILTGDRDVEIPPAEYSELMSGIEENVDLVQLNRMATEKMPLLKAIQPELTGEKPTRLLAKIIDFLKLHNPTPTL